MRHGRVATRQFLDGHVLRLVIGQSQIPIGAQQGFLGLLQMVYGLVDFIDSRLKPLGGEFVVFAERSFE